MKHEVSWPLPCSIFHTDSCQGPVTVQDVLCYHRLFKKETDARRYLHPSSYHPSNVFDSVIFSQMLRVIDRNSKDESCVEDLQQLREDLIRSGHSEKKLDESEPLAVLRSIENDMNGGSVREKNGNSIVFKTKYFDKISDLKGLVRSVDEDIKQLCGDDTRIVFALQKHPAIANNVVKNRGLSVGALSSDLNTADSSPRESQSCKASRCKTCPLLFKFDDDIIVNGEKLFLDRNLTCKSKNLIYVAQCRLCASKNGSKYSADTYFGQTMSKGHIRFNGHRTKFIIDRNESYTQSALSQHCFDVHADEMSLDFFKIGFVKTCNAHELNREENRFIQKFRTNIWGLNRINVIA